MTDKDRRDERTTDRQPERREEREERERKVAPPIEREHETQQGVFEEDEKRERGRK